MAFLGQDHIRPARPAVNAAISPAGPDPITSTSQKAKAFS
jgi:hypothetical protein